MLVCSEGKQLWGKLQGLQLEMLMGWVGDWPASTYPLRGNWGACQPSKNLFCFIGAFKKQAFTLFKNSIMS